MADIKAFLIDQDDTLTRHGDGAVYHRGAHGALTELLTLTGRAGDIPPFAEWQAFHHGMYQSNDCLFTTAADKYKFSCKDFFALMHRHIDDSVIDYDTASLSYLDQLADRAVIFTDASRAWAEIRAAAFGHKLPILARDDTGAGFERKQSGTARWQNAATMLSDRIGAPLHPSEILMIDDSAKVLLQAQRLGFATAHCHWGFPGRAHTTLFEYSIGSVGELANLLD